MLLRQRYHKPFIRPFLEISVVYENNIDFVIRRKRVSCFDTLYIDGVRKELGHTQRQVVSASVQRAVELLDHSNEHSLIFVGAVALQYYFGEQTAPPV